MRSLLRTLAFIALPALALATPASAQEAAFPTKDISFICTFPPGSGADVLVRYFAEKLKPFVAPHSVIVENKPGAAGKIAIEYTAKSQPDGHTVLLTAGTSIAGSMSLLKNPTLDVAKAFQMVATLNRQAFLLVVANDSPHKTVAELTAAMKEAGDKASYATAATSGIVMGELYKANAGLDAVQVIYPSSAASLNDMTAGQVAYGTVDPVYGMAQVREGRLRGLAVSSGERMQALPDLPTMKESGVDMDLTIWWSASVPAGTPKPVIDKLNGWFNEILAQEETKKFLNSNGGDPYINTPEDTQAMFLKAIEQWREFIRVAKIEPAG